MIAEKSLLLQSATRKEIVKIAVMAPEENDGSWFCSFEIHWPEGKHELRVGGADSVQALVCALQLLGAEIYASNYHKSGHLTSADGAKGYGIPVPPNFRPDLIGDDAKYI